MSYLPGISIFCGKTTEYGGKNKINQRLSALSVKTGCQMKQENGQRFFGPPASWIGDSPKNSEVYISKLPIDCYEDEIYEFCSRIGHIFLIRLMVTFEGTNRGFCFVSFANEYEAFMATQVLPKMEIRTGCYVNVEISHNNRSVEIVKINPAFNEVQLRNDICGIINNVTGVNLSRSPIDCSWKATLYFENHQQAAVARRRLNEIAFSKWGKEVKVHLVNNKYKPWANNKIQNRNVASMGMTTLKNILV